MKDEDFSGYYCILLSNIELAESIIPDSLKKLLLEKTAKVKNEFWVVHKNDVDPFPSNPHAHNYEANVKLHLGNGCLYRKRKKVGRIKKNELITIRQRISTPEIKLPTLEI